MDKFIQRFDELNVGDLILIETTSKIMNSMIECLNKPTIFLSYQDYHLSHAVQGLMYTSSGSITILGSDIIRLLARASEAVDV